METLLMIKLSSASDSQYYAIRSILSAPNSPKREARTHPRLVFSIFPAPELPSAFSQESLYGGSGLT